MGGWYLQPDCNMPSGESIVRNIQMGRAFFDKSLAFARPQPLTLIPLAIPGAWFRYYIRLGMTAMLSAVRAKAIMILITRILSGKVFTIAL